MKRLLLVVTLIFFQPQTIKTDLLFNFVVWDVGQGSWATYFYQGSCYHIDMGGEKFPKKVLNYCKNKNNFLFLTHEDWDHLNFISRFRKSTTHFCLLKIRRPRRLFLNKLDPCKMEIPPIFKIIESLEMGTSENEKSLILLIDNKILITGDAPKKHEKKWFHRLPKKITLLVLGHHGSNTSTSKELLQHTHFQMAIASSRKKRYGHPHPKVILRLKKKGISLLSTEIQRSLFFNLK